MKTLLHLLLGLCASVVLTAHVLAESDEPKLSSEEIQKLVAPIALYPDSLVALIMPASTMSSDVVLAARFFANGGQPSDVDHQTWAESVKSLAHYPELIKWMDDNLEWTQQLGSVFSSQPADVMTAIQILRAHAREDGLLTDTPQQRVVVEDDAVYIEPAQPDVIYIPRYDPEYLWMRRPCYGPYISFGIGFGVGDWLFYDCGWSDRIVYVHRRGPSWHYVRGWRPPMPSVRVNIVREWHPDPRYRHGGSYYHPSRPVAVIPRPFDTDSRHSEPRDYDRGRDWPPQNHGDVHSRWDHSDNKVSHVEDPRPQRTPSRPQPPAAAPIVPEHRGGYVDRREGPARPVAGPPSQPTPPAHAPTRPSVDSSNANPRASYVPGNRSQAPSSSASGGSSRSEGPARPTAPAPSAQSSSQRDSGSNSNSNSNSNRRDGRGN